MLKRRFPRSLAVASLICLASGYPAHAQVTGAALSTTPLLKQNDCPAVVTFKGTVTSNSAGIVTYIFTRSDGATDTITKKLVFKKPGTLPVSTTWTLGGTTLPFYKGWQAIKILSPNPMTSPQAPFELHCNPPANSAISAHGNTDWHIDTANEFLFGVDMGGSATAPNHAPDGWSKRHMHVGQTNTSKYYYDKGHTPSGEDTNASSGIDQTMLFFYAGHGNPTGWSTLGDSASQGNMTLANVTGGGMLRYYWQCSCEVFAHGPKVCAGASMDYACPQNFSGSTDTDAMRDVFKRWGPVLTPDLRMACGMSTSAYCHEGNVNKVWDNYNNHGLSVADSFINGFGDWGVVPLCITTGGANITATPLYDSAFTNKPNTSGATHYHIRYPSGSASAHKPLEIHMIPKYLPLFKLVAADVSPALRRMSAKPVATLPDFAGGKATVRIEPKSGAVFLKTVQVKLPVRPTLTEQEHLSRAKKLVTDLGWYDSELGEPVVTKLMNASMPINGASGDIKQTQDGVLVTYKRQIEIDGKRIDILGEGGITNIRMANDGGILSASRVWRKIVPNQVILQIKSFEEARNEALAKTGRAEAYKLDQWKFGYKEQSVNGGSDELRPVFQFAFLPVKAADQMNTPPRLVEISAEK
ncbi:MAG: hypothetical protein HXX11_01595 [Desulfuromonadales bacterium]|nr:hypothetical protein [Desulfuromonadales bacterium]